MLSDDCPLSTIEDALAAAIMAPGAPDPRVMRHTPTGQRLRKANMKNPGLNMVVAGSKPAVAKPVGAKATS